MELLLNLTWLLLALPAYWLWRGRKTSRGFSSLQCLLALGCLLVVLFPVISATDDLCAMKAEMEESPSGKKAIRHAGSERPWLWNAAMQGPAVLPVSAPEFSLTNESRLKVFSSSVFLPAAPVVQGPSRAPPQLIA